MSGTRPDPAKLYRPKMSTTWWLRKKSYFLFMLRELSSVFIALFLLVYLCPNLSVNQRDPTPTSHSRKNSIRRDGFFST